MKRALVAVLIMAGYAWVIAGAAPFSALAYLLVATPCVAFVVAYARMGGLSVDRGEVNEYFRRIARGTTLSSVAPWTALLTAVAALEVVGLLLGGRSTSVPTLSTTVDHLLAVRWERFLLCWAWLFTGGFALLRHWRRFHVRRS
jgi:hypothetical protein